MQRKHHYLSLVTDKVLSKENVLFIWNLLLKDLLINNQSIDKNSTIQKCKEYYYQNLIEIKNIIF